MSEKLKIKETIVVEGKDDETRLKQLYDVNIIKTGGTHLGQKKLEEILAASKVSDIIVFTDPDHPGEEIRRKVNEYVPNCKNAFLTSKARRGRLVGVEHASDAQIKEALENLVVFTEEKESLSRNEFVELGLMGENRSEERRIFLEDTYHLGHGSAKSLLKRLNHKQLTYTELKKVLEENGY